MALPRRWPYFLVALACLQFVGLTTVAMYLYPGGTHLDANTLGYSFFENFFSDLGLTVAHSGMPNTLAGVLFVIALSLAGMGMVVYFLSAPGLFGTRSGRILSLLGSLFGIVAGLAFVGVAFAPADLLPQPHLLLVQVAFLAFLAAAVPYALALFMNERYGSFYALVMMGFTILLAAYVWLLFYGPEPTSAEGLIVQATGQKIIAYAAVGSIFLQAVGALRELAAGPV